MSLLYLQERRSLKAGDYSAQFIIDGIDRGKYQVKIDGNIATPGLQMY